MWWLFLIVTARACNTQPVCKAMGAKFKQPGGRHLCSSHHRCILGGHAHLSQFQAISAYETFYSTV